MLLNTSIKQFNLPWASVSLVLFSLHRHVPLLAWDEFLSLLFQAQQSLCLPLTTIRSQPKKN